MKNTRVLYSILALCLPAAVTGADVALFGIIKSQEYVQTSTAAPTARPTNGFAFNALVLASTNNVVTNATVKPSNATPLRTLLPLAADNVTWRFEERFNTQGALDATYPNGTLFSPVNYTVTMGTVNDGVRTANLNYSTLALLGQPATPQVTNFNAAQSIDHTANFTLRFNSSGNATIDLVQVIITDTASNVVFASPAPFSAGTLTGASNSVVIPGYTLPPGTNLVGHLTFVRPTFLETNAYPGAIGVPAVLKDTEFPVVTRPAPMAPVLEVLSPNAAPFQLRYTGEANRIHHLQGTTNFTDWTDVLVTTNVSTATFSDPASGALNRRFYRVQVGP